MFPRCSEADTATRSTRLHLVIKRIILVLGIGILYGLFFSKTGIGIPCPFYLATGLRCPGCGITHLFVSLLHFDIPAAFSSNPMVFCLLPAALFLLLYWLVQYIRVGVFRLPAWYNYLVYGMIILLLLFGIVRNLPM